MAASISTVVKTKRDGTIKVEDATTGTALSLEVAYEEGNLNLTIPGPTVVVFLDRGEFGATPSIRYGDDQPIAGTFSAYLRDLADATYITLESILCNAGIFASTWVSTLGANAEVKTTKVTWTIEGTDHGDTADHTLVLNHCTLLGSLQEGVPALVNANITAYDVWPTLT